MRSPSKTSCLLRPRGPIGTTLELLRNRFPAAGLTEFLQTNRSSISRQSQAAVDPEGSARLMRRLQELANDEHIFREAGRTAAAPGTLGAFRESLLALLHPTAGFRYLRRLLSRQEGVACDLHRTGERRVQLSLTCKTQSCNSFYLGLIEGFAHRYLPYRLAVVQDGCNAINRGGCRYLIEWEQPAAAKWLKLRNVLILSTCLLLLAMPLLPITGPALLFAMIGSTVVVAGIGQMCLHRDLAKDLSNLHRANEALIDQANSNISQARLDSEVRELLGDCQDFSDVARRICSLIEHRLSFNRGLVVLWNRSKGDQTLMASFGFPHHGLQSLVENSALFGRSHEPAAWQRLLRRKNPLTIADLDDDTPDLSLPGRTMLKEIGFRNLICLPLFCDKKTVGLMLVANVTSRRPPLPTDLALAGSIAAGASNALQTIALLDARSEQFKATLQILASSIDARDFLTAGHSETVTEYAIGICQEMKLSHNFTEMIRVAALLHDYGKIGVPDFILKKSGPLTPDERAIIRTHPLKGQQILQQIPFTGFFKQIPEIVGGHHEKLDGSGYPRGLVGRQIPLGARIIAVADFFDAITSKRHYRNPMPLEDALRLLKLEGENHFDRDVVAAFMRFAQRHRQQLEQRVSAPDSRGDRKLQRIPFRTQVSCQVDQSIVTGVSANLSPGGIFVASDKVPDARSPVEVIFHLPQASERLVRARGQVAWVNSEGTKRNLPKGFGLEFTSLPQDSEQVLRSFLASRTLHNFDDLSEEIGLTN